MNAKQFMYLMNTLPDDMIESAVRYKRRRTNKLFVLLPPAAACFAVAMTAVIYPKLKVSPPEMRENDLTTSATTLSASAETVTVLSSDTSVTNLFFSDAATTHSTAKTTETGTAVSTDSYVTSLISSAAATTGYTAEMTGNVTVLSTVITAGTTAAATKNQITESTPRPQTTAAPTSATTRKPPATITTAPLPVSTGNTVKPLTTAATGIVTSTTRQNEFTAQVTTKVMIVTTATTEKTEPQTTAKATADLSAHYVLVPRGLNWQRASDIRENIRVTVSPGQTFTVDWLVEFDPGTTGMQIDLDFSQLCLRGIQIGNAYDVEPETGFTSDDRFHYAWSKSRIQKCNAREPICSFSVQAPSVPGTYRIGTDSNAENIVIGEKDKASHLLYFQGLDIIVKEDRSVKGLSRLISMIRGFLC